MNEYKSISEIAKELKVSRQAVYQKIKTNTELSAALSQLTVKRNSTTFYSLQAQNLIKQAFESAVNVNYRQTIDSKPTSIDSKLIDSLTKQLEVKDEQIKSLTEQVSSLVNQIAKLTTALQAAQALHGMDKQQKAIEVQPQTEKPAQKSRPAPKQKKPRPQKPFSLMGFFKKGKY